METTAAAYTSALNRWERMRNPIALRRLRDSHEGGAAAVEFAILAPLVFAILFGMLSGAMLWNSKQTMTHAAREAARFGAVLPVDGDIDAWRQSVADHAVEAAFGELGPSVDGRYVCVALVPSDDGPLEPFGSSSRPPDLVTGDAVAANQCFEDDSGRPADESRVQVVVSKSGRLTAIIYNPSLTLTSGATARYEVFTPSEGS